MMMIDDEDDHIKWSRYPKCTGGARKSMRLLEK